MKIPAVVKHMKLPVRVPEEWSEAVSLIREPTELVGITFSYKDGTQETKTIKTNNMSRFVINTRKNGEFQFNLKAHNGQVILTSDGFTTKPSTINCINSVIRNSQIENKFVKVTAKNGKFYFYLKAGNGACIGNSEMFENEEDREKGILAVMECAKHADIITE